MFGKTHLFDDRVKEEDYSNSPHVLEAIRNKDFAYCQSMNTGRTSSKIEEVTCIGCLTKMEIRLQEQRFKVRYFNDYIQESLDSGISECTVDDLITRMREKIL